ncbi:MAG: ketoacyl-ACP synthase III [Defluviitaleaceae bacterium]|nr:ketoacyl-ACP synthase III [Defluviitaleaceae bacterium]
MGIKIIGTGRKMPSHVVTNTDLADFLDTSEEWIISKTGIHTRHICTDESLTDLAVSASLTALNRAGIEIEDVSMLICATTSGDYKTPSLACCVLEKLGGFCTAFDVNAACTGFIYALDVADSFIRSGKANTVLVVAAEMISRIVNWEDRTSCVLFGDGASACVVTNGNTLKYIRTMSDPQVEPLFSKTGYGNNPFIKVQHSTCNYVQMQGGQVYKFAVKTIENEIRQALRILNMKAEDVDFFMLHQANNRIIEGARNRLQLPSEKFPTNINQYGNMSAASIPVLLDEMIEDNKIKDGDVVIMIGFGAGMTAGTAAFVWEN